VIVQRARTGKMRIRAGVRERFCHAEEVWLPESKFRKTRRKSGFTYETICVDCARLRRQESYQRRREEVNRRNRERWERLRDATRAADQKASRTEIHVRPDLVASWIQEWQVMNGSDSARSVATAARVPERTVRQILSGEIENVAFEVAERIATLTDRREEASALLVTGKPGWSHVSDHCLRCGRFDRPHYATGHCVRCYKVLSWHRRHGSVAPPPREERWTVQAPAGCKHCRSCRGRHVARGLCVRCYGAHVRAARKLAMDVREFLDQRGYRRSVKNPVFDRRPANA
jgi:hypothetical protein